MISWGLPRFHRRVKAAIRVVTTVAIQPLRVTTREGRREGRPSTARSCSRVRGWGLSSTGAAMPACDDAGAAMPAVAAVPVCAPDDDAGPCAVPSVAGAAVPAVPAVPTCDDTEAPDGATPPC